MELFVEIVLTNAGFAVALALIAAMGELLRLRPALVRGLWLLVLLRLFAPPLLMPVYTVPADPPPPPPIRAPAAPTTDFTAPAVEVPHTPLLTPEHALLGLWWAGAALMLLVLGRRTRHLRGWMAAAAPTPTWLEERLTVLSEDLGLRRPPRAVVVEAAVSPMLWALPGKVRLIVPAGLLERLSPEERDTLIAHELAHLRRRDHWARYLELAALVVFWWHPVVWWAGRRLRRAEEECCDALVTSILPRHRRAYAECLIKTLRFLTASRVLRPALGTPASGGEVHDLKGRLTMIMTRPTSQPLSLPLRGVLLVAALLLLAVFPTIAQDEAIVITEADPRFTGEPVDLDKSGIPFVDLLMELAAVSELNFIVMPGLDLSGEVTVRGDGIPWDQAMATLLKARGLGYSREGNVYWVFSAESRHTGGREFTGSPINISVKDGDLREMIGTFSEVSGLNFVLPEGLKGSVTMELKEVPWDQALEAVLSINHLGMSIEGEAVRILPLG